MNGMKFLFSRFNVPSRQWYCYWHIEDALDIKELKRLIILHQHIPFPSFSFLLFLVPLFSSNTPENLSIKCRRPDNSESHVFRIQAIESRQRLAQLEYKSLEQERYQSDSTDSSERTRSRTSFRSHLISKLITDPRNKPNQSHRRRKTRETRSTNIKRQHKRREILHQILNVSLRLEPTHAANKKKNKNKKEPVCVRGGSLEPCEHAECS